MLKASPSNLEQTPTSVLNPFSHEFHENPFPLYARLRDEQPVYFNEEMGFYALTRFADVFEAFRDWGTYSSARGVALESMAFGGSGSQDMIETDPPDHTRLRKMVARMFTNRRIGQIEDQVREVCNRWLDRLPGPEFDFIKDFSGPFPMDVICEILGVEEADRDTLRHHADQMVARDEGSIKVPQATIDSFFAITGYFADRLDQWRQPGAPGLIAELLDMQAGDDGPTDDEVVGFCLLFIIAGHETTTKMLANAADLLDQHPEQRARLARDPELIPNAIEEVMRYNNSSQYMARWLTRDVDLHGVQMRKDHAVLLIIGAANRDPREFDDPDRFDIERKIDRSLAFGHGAHFCLGAHLARLEGRVALGEFLRRFPEWEVQRGRAERIHAGNVMGWSSLPVTTS